VASPCTIRTEGTPANLSVKYATSSSSISTDVSWSTDALNTSVVAP
jgi:hypothetical protein